MYEYKGIFKIFDFRPQLIIRQSKFNGLQTQYNNANY